MKKIAILSIHGIGQQKPGFAQKFHNKLIKKNNLENEIKAFEFEWQHLIEFQENFLISKLSFLKWKFTRSFMLSFIGDAIAYAKDSVFYKNVHSELNDKLLEINDWLEDNGEIYIIAHSLGTVIIFDFIYNLQNYNALGNKIFRATAINPIQKLACLVTLGSPLYIYSLQRLNGGNSIKINKWINIYSLFDIIGYPVKQINKYFKEENSITDEAIICGSILTYWNPFSHIAYFSSSKVFKILNRLFHS